jgi:predicted permease
MLAPLGMTALISFLPRDTAANALHSGIDGRVLLFATIVSVGAGIFTGLTPALQAGRGALMTTLRERAGTALHGLRLRRALVTAQITFTLILLTGAALFIRTLSALIAKGPGFETSSLISFGIDPGQNGYPSADAARLVRRIYDEIRTSPITRSVAVARVELLQGGSWNNPMTIQAGDRIITDREVHLNAVSPGFFATLGARIVAGRDFDERDIGLKGGGEPVAIINEAFAKRYLSGRNPLGCRVALGAGPLVRPQIEVIGVVSNINYRGVREQWEQAYVPIMSTAASFYDGGTFYVRVQGTADTAYGSIRAILRNIDPTLPITYFRTLDEQVRRSLNTERMLAALSGSFGTLALLLSLVGLYGIMSFVVTQRTREIGVRLALGATRAGTAWLVLRDALLMIAAGIALALPCVWGLGRLIESQLYDVKPTDPATITAAVCVLAAGVVSAALIPARRASAINPTDALRFE